jgi:hypothetical protein
MDRPAPLRAARASPKKHGLLSRSEADARGVNPARPGGDALTRALEAHRRLQDYVFLGFHENGLMPKDGEAQLVGKRSSITRFSFPKERLI